MPSKKAQRTGLSRKKRAFLAIKSFGFKDIIMIFIWAFVIFAVGNAFLGMPTNVGYYIANDIDIMPNGQGIGEYNFTPTSVVLMIAAFVAVILFRITRKMKADEYGVEDVMDKIKKPGSH